MATEKENPVVGISTKGGEASAQGQEPAGSLVMVRGRGLVEMAPGGAGRSLRIDEFLTHRNCQRRYLFIFPDLHPKSPYSLSTEASGASFTPVDKHLWEQGESLLS